MRSSRGQIRRYLHHSARSCVLRAHLRWVSTGEILRAMSRGVLQSISFAGAKNRIDQLSLDRCRLSGVNFFRGCIRNSARSGIASLLLERVARGISAFNRAICDDCTDVSFRASKTRKSSRNTRRFKNSKWEISDEIVTSGIF